MHAPEWLINIASSVESTLDSFAAFVTVIIIVGVPGYVFFWTLGAIGRIYIRAKSRFRPGLNEWAIALLKERDGHD